MSLHGLDLNASRVRAVRGPLGDYPLPELPEPPRAELPLVVSLEGRAPVLGGAGLRLCRKAPHLVWQNVLPHLGEAAPRPIKQRIDADKVVTQLCQGILRNCNDSRGVAL